MILIIGSQGAGKKDYLLSLGYQESDMATAVLDDKPILLETQELLRSGNHTELELLDVLSQKSVVCCREVGSGIIPAVPQERAWREATGRLCVMLAQRAEKVIRIVAGIPQVIRGE